MSKRRVFSFGAIGMFLAVGGVLFATSDQWGWFVADGDPTVTDVAAPTIDDLDLDTELLYRISPDNGSSVSYAVAEKLAGQSRVAVGTTTVVAGDIVVNTEDPSASRIGDIVVNVNVLTSDSKLRDKRIRHDFLESSQYPFATFEPAEVGGLPSAIEATTSAPLTISGDLVVKGVAAPATFSGTAVLTADQLTATMTGTILLSTYDAGPISVSGLASSGNEVTLTFDLVADHVPSDSPTPADDELKVALPNQPAGSGDFSLVVQPILESACVSCHISGGPGSTTWQLDTAGDAAAIADDIAFLTTARYMPPWPASDDSVPFSNHYGLTAAEIDAIAEWAAAGGGLDVDPETALVATADPIKSIERDQVVTPAEPYVGDLAVADDYRCQIYEIADDEGDGTWITGLSFEPDKVEVVHHAIIYRVPESARQEAETLDGADGKPGWTCFGLSNMQSEGVVSIGGWAPGQQPRQYPESVGIFLEPGDLIVNQIHYHFDHDTPADSSALVFDTISAAEQAELPQPMRSIQGRSYLTPAEGPCTPEESGPLCSRATVIKEFETKYGGVAPFIPDFLIRQCGGTVDDYDDLDGTRFSSSCDLPAADFGTIFSIRGHMHEFGDAYRMVLNPDTPSERVLLDIPRWSFDWQLDYTPEEEIRIEPGDVVRFECTWDRANLYMPEPRYITWNEGTVDEMCFSSIAVIPDP